MVSLGFNAYIGIDQDFDQIISAKAHNVGLSTCSISITFLAYEMTTIPFYFAPVILFSSIY